MDFHASVHFPLTSRAIKSRQHWIKFLWMARYEPGAAGWKAQMLPLCDAPPYLQSCLVKIPGGHQLLKIFNLSGREMNPGLYVQFLLSVQRLKPTSYYRIDLSIPKSHWLMLTPTIRKFMWQTLIWWRLVIMVWVYFIFIHGSIQPANGGPF